MQKEEKEMLIQEDVLQLGFTKSMIKKLLPEPTRSAHKNFHGTYCNLWEKELVLQVIKSEDFKELYQLPTT